MKASAPRFPERRGHGNFSETLGFLSRFVSGPTAIGAVMPSSRKLAEAMLEGITLQPGDCVVEYGPGTGPFTSLLLERMPEGARYLGIERDAAFHAHLVRRFPGVRFHHGSAEEAPDLLDRHGLESARLILSGLPFASMPARIQESILWATRKILHEEGVFRTFSYPFSWYVPGSVRFRRLAGHHFSDHHKGRTVLKNFPPAKVLSFRKPVPIPSHS